MSTEKPGWGVAATTVTPAGSKRSVAVPPTRLYVRTSEGSSEAASPTLVVDVAGTVLLTAVPVVTVTSGGFAAGPVDGTVDGTVDGAVVVAAMSSSRTWAALSGAGRSSVTWLPTMDTPTVAAATAPAAPRSHTATRIAVLRTVPMLRDPARARLKATLTVDEEPVIARSAPTAGRNLGPVSSVLVIEDDLRIREALATALTGAGHAVRTEHRGADGLSAVVQWRPDVVVLDLGLPDMDGADVLAMMRGVSSVPVIVATARDDESEVVRLLDAGADDYVVKPYSAEQLLARIRAVLRRGGQGEDADRSVVAIGALVVDTDRRTVTLHGAPVDLSRLEFDLLAHLARRSPEVVTRRELLSEVWRQPHGGADKTIDVHVSWLRRKLDETASAPRYLHTVRGVGIRLAYEQD